MYALKLNYESKNCGFLIIFLIKIEPNLFLKAKIIII